MHRFSDGKIYFHVDLLEVTNRNTNPSGPYSCSVFIPKNINLQSLKNFNMVSETDTPFLNCDPHLGPVAMVMEFETFPQEKDSKNLKDPPPQNVIFIRFG